MTDPDLIDTLLREQLPALRRYALWLARDASAADDLVQATVERALGRWSDRREPDGLRAWLFAILYRQFLDERRRSRRYAWLLNRFGADHDLEQPSVEREVQANAVLQAFARLPPEQRSLLYWVTVEGLSYKEVAAILQVPIGTVMSRLSRARQALRRLGDGEARTPPIRLLK